MSVGAEHRVPVADTEAGWSDDNGDEETWDDWGSGDPEAPSGAPIDSSGGSPSGGAAASSSGNSIAGAELVGTVQSPTVGGMTAAGSGVRAAPNGAGAAAAAGAGGASAHLPRPGGPTVRPTPGAPMDSVSPTATAGASSSVEAPAVNFFDELGMKPVVTKAKRIAAPNVSAAATTSRFAMDTLIDVSRVRLSWANAC